MWMLFEYGDEPGQWDVLAVSKDKAALDAECLRLRRIEYDYECKISKKSRAFSITHPFEQWEGSFAVEAVPVWPQCADSFVIKMIKRRLVAIDPQ